MAAWGGLTRMPLTPPSQESAAGDPSSTVTSAAPGASTDSSVSAWQRWSGPSVQRAACRAGQLAMQRVGRDDAGEDDRRLRAGGRPPQPIAALRRIRVAHQDHMRDVIRLTKPRERSLTDRFRTAVQIPIVVFLSGLAGNALMIVVQDRFSDEGACDDHRYLSPRDADRRCGLLPARGRQHG